MADVQDGRVRSIIQTELLKFSANDNVTQRVGAAFRSLQERRQKREPLDIDLAAAEHYMFARYLAGVTGDPFVKMGPTLYGLKKRFYFALGIQQRMAVTANPVLPPSPAVERWGLTGATEGLDDFVAVNGKPADNYGKAVTVLAQEAVRYNK